MINFLLFCFIPCLGFELLLTVLVCYRPTFLLCLFLLLLFILFYFVVHQCFIKKLETEIKITALMSYLYNLVKPVCWCCAIVYRIFLCKETKLLTKHPDFNFNSILSHVHSWQLPILHKCATIMKKTAKKVKEKPKLLSSAMKVALLFCGGVLSGRSEALVSSLRGDSLQINTKLF